MNARFVFSSYFVKNKLENIYHSPHSSDVPRVHLDQLYPRREEEEVIYTSPLTVKVYEEVKEKRKEEVDLETGRRTSFVEVERYEVLDLTGATPKRRESQRTPLQSLPGQNSEATTNSNITKTTKIRGRLPPPSAKSPGAVLCTSSHQYPDVSVLCLSSPTPTPGEGSIGSMAPPATSRTPKPARVPPGTPKSNGARSSGPRARPSKYPLLR